MLFPRRRSTADWMDLIPRRTYDHELTDEGKVVVIIPKFQRPPFNRLMRRMKAPNIRVKLDGIGSFVWLHCDGERNVSTIVRILRDEFGETAEPAEERVHLFFQQLQRGGMVRLFEPSAAGS
ncbi:MAG: PqqD family protein [Acidobacteria bacterium]|nr:PqqD family protein [Acidobacteriota bacterium]